MAHVVASLAEMSNYVLKVATYNTDSMQRYTYLSRKDLESIRSAMDSSTLKEEGRVYEVGEVEPSV